MQEEPHASSESYIDQLRRLVDKRTLIVPAARAIIQDPHGRVLLIRRRDNLRWGLPTGGMEVGESIFDCLVREVKEETGLQVTSATPIAVYSGPRFQYVDAQGDRYQLLALVFRVQEWGGALVRETEETVDARFFALTDLPEMVSNQIETLQDLKQYQGHLILK